MSDKKKKRELTEHTCADEGEDDQPFMPIPINKRTDPPLNDKDAERDKKEPVSGPEVSKESDKTSEGVSPKAPTPSTPSASSVDGTSPVEVTAMGTVSVGAPPTSPDPKSLPSPTPPSLMPAVMTKDDKRDDPKRSIHRKDRTRDNATVTQADVDVDKFPPIQLRPATAVPSSSKSNSGKGSGPFMPKATRTRASQIQTRNNRTPPPTAKKPGTFSGRKRSTNKDNFAPPPPAAPAPPPPPPPQRSKMDNKVDEELAIQNSIQLQDEEYWTLVDQTVINREYFHGYFTMHYITKMLRQPGDYILGILPYNNEKKGWHLASGIGLCVAFRDIRFIPIKGGKRKQYRFKGGKVTKPTVQELVAEYACGQGLPQPFDNGVERLVYLTRPVSRAAYILPHKRVQLHDRIGGGNFGVVYNGTLLDRNKKFNVAVKIFKPSTLSAGPGTNRTKDILHQKKFLEEAYVMWQLKHPNIVHFFGICSLKPALMIIMEYCTGGCVRSYLQKQGDTVPVSVKNRFAIEACEGLKYLTNRDFVHRDVAARNCLIDENLTLKVADFGLTTDAEVLRRKGDNANAMVLPIKWASPEVLRSGDFSWASDVWAFGVMLFELYNEAREPYTGLRNRIVREELLKGAGFRMELPPSIPLPIRSLMMRCWEEVPMKRPNFTALADELRKAKRLIEEN
ncbi:unnamed protein product, partial [Mesorhabditis spiculigera]